jgi:hypothetical protein
LKYKKNRIAIIQGGKSRNEINPQIMLQKYWTERFCIILHSFFILASYKVIAMVDIISGTN